LPKPQKEIFPLLSLILLEFRKLLGYRSVRLALVILFMLPWIWSFSTALLDDLKFVFVSMWQMPALVLTAVMQFILPLLVSMTAAELLGAEVSAGTLAPLLLRPLERYKALGAKYVVALLYPLLLLVALLLSSLLAGARFGVGGFIGGTGFGVGAFIGEGPLEPLQALGQIVQAFLIAGATLAPIAALALMFTVIFMNTAAAALATIVTLNIMRLLAVNFPVLKAWMLTNYLDVYVGTPDTLLKALIILLLYTVAITAVGLFVFEKKDL